MEMLIAIAGAVLICLLMLLGFHAAKGQERERCARLVESYALPEEFRGLAAMKPWNKIIGKIAFAIRATGSDGR